MKHKVKLFAALSMILFSLNANAAAKTNCWPAEYEDDDTDEVCEQVNSYSYIGLKGGNNRIRSTTVASSESTAIGAVWGYRSNDLFTTEIGYISLASYTAATGDMNARAIDLALLHTWQMSEGFGLFGRLGIAYSTVVTNIAGQGQSGYDITYGAGFEFGSITSPINMRIGIDRYRLKIDGNDDLSQLAYLSFIYKY